MIFGVSIQPSAVSYVPETLKYKEGQETDADNIPEIKTSESWLLLLLGVSVAWRSHLLITDY